MVSNNIMAGTLASQSFPAPTMKREHDQMLQAGQASFMSAPDHSYLHPQATSFSPQKSTQFPPTINPTSNQIHAAPLAVMTAPSLGGPLRPSEKPQIYTVCIHVNPSTFSQLTDQRLCILGSKSTRWK